MSYREIIVHRAEGRRPKPLFRACLNRVQVPQELVPQQVAPDVVVDPQLVETEGGSLLGRLEQARSVVQVEPAQAAPQPNPVPVPVYYTHGVAHDLTENIEDDQEAQQARMRTFLASLMQAVADRYGQFVYTFPEGGNIKEIYHVTFHCRYEDGARHDYVAHW